MTKRMSRCGWLLLFGIAAFLNPWETSGKAGVATVRHPNILFLMSDEHRHDAMGIAGNRIVKTPNLDRLARSGVRFTQAYTASPVCSPSRATLFTGRYPHIHGVMQNGVPLNKGEVALPELLKHYGYVTGMSGKLHLPPDTWFDTAWITAGGAGKEYQEFLIRKIPGFQGRSNTAAIPETLIGPPRTPLRIGTSVLPEEWFEEAWVADRAIDFLREQKTKASPWFLFVSMLKPHSEFVVPKPYDKMYRAQDMPLPASFRPQSEPPAELARDITRRRRNQDANQQRRAFIGDAEVLREVIAHYYGAVTLVDKHMGRLLKELDSLGMGDNTLVVFTADHGNMLGERNRMFKGVMYESSARVPLLIHAPGILPAGKVVNRPVDNSAVMPTLLELAGIPVPAGIQGRSLVPLAGGERSAQSSMAFSVLHDRMIRSGDWKLIVPLPGKEDPRELYHVVTDPHEQKNLYGKPEAAETQRKLEAALEEWWNHKPPRVTVAKETGK